MSPVLTIKCTERKDQNIDRKGLGRELIQKEQLVIKIGQLLSRIVARPQRMSENA